MENLLIFALGVVAGFIAAGPQVIWHYIQVRRARRAEVR